MKSTIEGIITKGEIKFWMGVIALIVTLMAGFYNIKTELALLRLEVVHLAEQTEAVNSKFGAIHTDTIDLDRRVIVLESIK